MQYKAQEFNIPDLKGLSSKQLEVHLGLYAGYVKNVNHLREQLHDLEQSGAEKYAYAITETRRRLAFEFNGMRMHEYYFETFENGASLPDTNGALQMALGKKYGNFEKCIQHFKTVGATRGIGWTVLYWDAKVGTPHISWVGDHELGVLAGAPILLAMDMWEHAYMVDYAPAEKGEYISAFFNNLNWSVIERRFQSATL